MPHLLRKPQNAFGGNFGINFETHLKEVLNLAETRPLGIQWILLDLGLAAWHYIYINIYTFVVENLGVLKIKTFASHRVVFVLVC